MGFIEEINDLIILLHDEKTENSKKTKEIRRIREKYGVASKFGEAYNNEHQKNTKSRGIVYTPEPIVKHMCRKAFEDITYDRIKNMKICDPSCGTGNFIFGILDYIVDIYEKISENDLKNIIEKNIHVYDIDNTAVDCMLIDMYCKYGYILKNVKRRDYLYDDGEKYDLIIGNPPYIGHKDMMKEYKARLKSRFNTYKDKGDISFCFMEKGLEDIKIDGRMIFITSRYFIESLNGGDLREMILQGRGLVSITDFYGIRPFKGVGVDPAIINVYKGETQTESIEVEKPMLQAGEVPKNIFENGNFKKDIFTQFKVDKWRLKGKKWRLIDNSSYRIIDKIGEKSSCVLDDIIYFNQGVITGCDKAFVVNKKQSEVLEEYLIRKWIKNSHIRKGNVLSSDKRIIYSDIIEDKHIKESNAINHISAFKDKLQKRRECVKGIREWYKLQWGRELSMFDERKIIFPYKSDSNRFAIDSGSLFSADVYCMRKRQQDIDLDRLEQLLNTEIYEFYIKCTLKKLGNNLYEYYPNMLKGIKILRILSEEIDINDENLYEYLKICKEERRIIENMCKK